MINKRLKTKQVDLDSFKEIFATKEDVTNIGKDKLNIESLKEEFVHNDEYSDEEFLNKLTNLLSNTDLANTILEHTKSLQFSKDEQYAFVKMENYGSDDGYYTSTSIYKPFGSKFNAISFHNSNGEILDSLGFEAVENGDYVHFITKNSAYSNLMIKVTFKLS